MSITKTLGRIVPAVLAGTLLTGCGGGLSLAEQIAALQAFPGSGGGELSAAAYSASLADLSTIDTISTNPDVSIQYPTAANATMNGFITASASASTVVAGNLTIAGNFTAGTFTGTTSGFALFDSTTSSPSKIESLTGSLLITNDNITGAGIMTGDVDGTLTGPSGANTFDASMVGVVAEIESRNIALGQIAGNVTGTGGTITTDGVFYAIE